MRIVELSDFSMTVMKDSEDRFYKGLGEIQERVERYGSFITVVKEKQEVEDFHGTIQAEASESVCSGGKMILFFKDKLEGFKVGDRVFLLC